MQDPGFLLAAAPERLLAALPTITSQAGQLAAAAYETARHLLDDPNLGRAAAQLQLTARQRGANALADRIIELPYEMPCTVPWAQWSREARHLVLGRPHRGGETRSWSGSLDDRPVAVTGGEDTTVRVWDLRNGRQHGDPLERVGSVEAVAFANLDGRPVAVAGGYDDSVLVWDLRNDRQHGDPLEGHDGAVNAVAVGDPDGRLGRRHRRRGRDGAGVGPAHRPSARRPAHGPRRVGRTRWRSGTWTAVRSPSPAAGTPTVRVWDLRTGRQHGDPLMGHDGWVNAVAVGIWDGRPVAVTGGRDATVRVWDLRTGRQHGDPLDRATTGWVRGGRGRGPPIPRHRRQRRRRRRR